MSVSSPEEEAIRQQWRNEDVAYENETIERGMIENQLQEAHARIAELEATVSALRALAGGDDA